MILRSVCRILCTYAPKAQSCRIYLKRAPIQVGGYFICVGTAETGPDISVKVYIAVQLRSDLQARKIINKIYIK